MDLEEDIPSNWRVACDKATGVEYYYHKKTRLSQWTKPACLVALEEEEAEEVAAVGAVDEGKVDAISSAAVSSASYSNPAATTTTTTRAAQAIPIAGDDELVLNLEQQLSTLTGLASIIRNSSASGEGILEEAISVLYSCILPSTCDEILSQESTLLPSLIQICMQTKRVSIRRASLCCLFCFSLGRRNEQMFCTNQAWVSLADFVEKWQRLEDDAESGLLFGCIVGLLLSGKANRVISEDSVLYLSEWTTRLLDDTSQKGLDLESMALTHPSPEGECLFDGTVLQTLAKSTAGVPLSALVLLVLAKQALLKRKHSELFLQKGGGMSSLLLVCQCPWAATLVKKKARHHLLELLVSSSYARSTVLDSFLALSSATSLLPETIGRDPLCCHSAATIGVTRLEEEEEEEAEENEHDDEDDPEEGVGKRGSITDMLAREVVVPFSGAKDVVWKPREKKGTSYRVSSIVLWSHCPELRGTIESLWAEGEGGELELGTNTSQEALASVVKYIHSGVLIAPPSPNSRLELVKLAAELGSEPMLEAASNACLQHLTEETCGAALALARNMDLIEFEEALEIFLATGRRDSQQGNDEVLSSFHDDVMLMDEEEEVSFFASEEFAAKPSRGTTASNGGNSTRRPPLASSSHLPPPQSGGIYGLLLGNNSAGSSKPGNNNNSNNGTAANRRVPGKVPGDGKPASSAFGASNNNNKGRGGGGRMGANAGRGSGAGRGSTSTPSKQTAGGRGGRGGGGTLTQSTEGSWFAEEDCLHEFDTKMSLAPEREPSQREKRLQGLAAPKQLALAKPAISSDDGEEKQGLLGPKSSDSPSRKNKEVLASKDQEGEKETGVAKTTIDQSVRVSLALLKSKGLRRRRSVVDVENEESARSEKEKEEEGKEEEQEVEENAVLSEHATHQKVIATPKRASAQCTRTSGCQCSDCLVSDESSASLHTWQSQARSEIASARKLPTQAKEEAASNDEYDDGGGGEESGEALSECGNCGRKFRQEALTRHAKICEKVFLQKRKTFDSKRMRTQDNPELVSIVSSSKKQSSSRSSVDGSSSSSSGGGGGGAGGGKWKSESNAFREAMRNARETAQCVQLGLPLPPPIASAPDPSLIPCPHCGRRFNQKAGERHIPMCQNILAQPKALKKGSGQGAVSASLKTSNATSNGRGRF